MWKGVTGSLGPWGGGGIAGMVVGSQWHSWAARVYRAAVMMWWACPSVGASEQFRAEVYHGLDGLSEEKEYFFGCQGRVGPFGCCCGTVMDPPWHFCLFLCLGDG